MRAVVLQHETHEDLGLLEKALRDEGFDLTVRFRSVEHRDLEADLVVVMGGSMSATGTDERHPFIGDERAFLVERLAGNKPVLGICLGAQLLAAAAGAAVTAGKNGLEVGVAPVRLTKEGLADPIFAGAGTKPMVAHWHEDTYAAVPSAVLLASTDRYTQQAFRLGDSYGFQFHLELTAAKYAEWFEIGRETLELYEKPIDELRAGLPKLQAAEAANTAIAQRLAHHFASVARR